MRTIRPILAAALATTTLTACGTAETRSRSAAPPQTTTAVTPRVSATYANAEPSRPLTLADSNAGMQGSTALAHIPITCQTTYVQGHPTMLVGFSGAYEYDAYGSIIVEYVAAPFCEAANSGNREAFLVFAVRRPDLMRLYSCETGEITEWFDPKSLRNS
jgi:hypothetical protein